MGAVISGWPRYDYGTGTNQDGARNCGGLTGQGGFGLSVGIGNLDDTPDLEIFGTYDNHMMEVYKPSGVSVQMSSYYKRWYVHANPDTYHRHAAHTAFTSTPVLSAFSH